MFDLEPFKTSPRVSRAGSLSAVLIQGLLFFSFAMQSGDQCITAAPPNVTGVHSVAEQFDELVRHLYSLPSAEAALLGIGEFETAQVLDSQLQRRLDAQRERFTAILKSGKVRLGTDWVTPAELRAAVVSYNDEINRAFTKLQERDGRGFLTSLRKATTIYPDGFRARFVLGMAYSARGNLNPPEAERHFQSVLERAPNYLPALNNLALTQFRVGNYGDSFSTWKRLIEIAPDFPDAVHNLARIVREVEAGRLVFPDSTVKKRNLRSRADLFRELVDSVRSRSVGGHSAVQPGVGWLYSPLVVTFPEKQSVAVNDVVPLEFDASSGHQGIAGSVGTGLVVAPNVVLTARSTVHDDYLGTAARVRLLVARGDEIATLLGTVRNISDADDLALIDVPGVEGTFEIATEMTTGATVQISSAFPEFSLKGELTISAGKLDRLPAKNGKGLFGLVVPGEVSPGAPVWDAGGKLLGICTSAYAANLTGDRRTAIAAETLANRLTQWNVTLSAEASDSPPTSNPKRVAHVGRVIGIFNVDPMRLQQALPPEMRYQRSELEDQSCLRCNGLGVVQCPATGCARGGVTTLEWYTTAVDAGIYGKVLKSNSTATKSKCRTCNGAGRLRCPLCAGRGVHPDIQ